MGSPVDFDPISQGEVVSASTLHGNFSKINTYLNGPKVATGNIANPNSLSCVSYNFPTVLSGSSPDIHYSVLKVPQAANIVEAQLYMRTTDGSPTVRAILYKTFTLTGYAYSDPIFSGSNDGALEVTTANDWDTNNSPSGGGTIDSGGYIYLVVKNTNNSSSNDGLDVTVNIWFKTLHKA